MRDRVISRQGMDAPPRAHPRVRWAVSPRHAIGRLVIPALLSGATLVVVSQLDFSWWQRAIVGWDVGALALIALTWSVILRADSAETKRRAGGDDPGRHAVFGIALVASMFSFFAAAFVLRQVKSVPEGMRSAWTALTLAAIVLAWTLAHTVYTLRYAHLYYSRRHTHGPPGEHCLKFPGDDPPADIDFAYFSFTLGRGFQVSDVTVMSTPARRAVLLHAVVSFVYNTAILALALNLIFGSMS
jgi:uncharacterized membrane protein